jgi:hypothetical protein
VKWRYVVIGLGTLVVVSLLCCVTGLFVLGVIGSASSGSAGPTPTVSSLQLEDIMRNKKALTDAQWKRYQAAMVGVRVAWTCRVNEVMESGRVWVNPVGESSSRWMIDLGPLPRSVYMGFSRGQLVSFESTIKYHETLLGIMEYIYLTNTVTR